MDEETAINAIFISQRFEKKEDLSHVEEVKVKYPGVPVIVCAEHTTVAEAVSPMKKDATDYLQKPFTPDDLRKVLRELEDIVEKQKSGAHPLPTHPNPAPGNPSLGDLIFHSKNPKTQHAFDIAFRAATTDASILLLGPSGTGKSVLAREIHRRSSRKDLPFITVSCPSLSEHLLESELFGPVKGAFTGAVNDSWGKVHAANTGTLFLDEIGDMPLKIQPRLLRLLQEMKDRKIHLRISCVPTVSGDKLSIRIFDESQIFGDISELRMDETQSDLIKEWLGNIQGLFLVVGAVGSGKSTTLYALLNQLRKRTRSVVTIEDPVEYRIDGVNQIQVSPETGFGFSDALKVVMRIDPDDIMLGEIRDPLSAAAAVDAAATGKVLISTLHSRDAVGAVISLRNYGVKDHEIAALLEIVVAGN